MQLPELMKMETNLLKKQKMVNTIYQNISDEGQGENSSSTDVVTPEYKAIEDNDKAVVSSDDEVINPAEWKYDDQIYAMDSRRRC